MGAALVLPLGACGNNGMSQQMPGLFGSSAPPKLMSRGDRMVRWVYNAGEERMMAPEATPTSRDDCHPTGELVPAVEPGTRHNGTMSGMKMWATVSSGTKGVRSSGVATSATVGPIFAAMGRPPGLTVYTFLVAPLLQQDGLQALVVKAAPLIMMGVGLSLA